MLEILENHDLSANNTLRLPCVARYFARLTTLSHCAEAADFASRKGVPLLILGSGSNVVLRERYPGLAVHVCLPGITMERRGDTTLVTAGAGESWQDLVDYCLDHGCYGLENLALIPGTVGAAPVQNIGAYGVELHQLFHSLRGWDCALREWRELDREDCRFSYRDSVFKRSLKERFIISSVTLALSAAPRNECSYPELARELASSGLAQPTPQQIAAAVKRLRRRKLPDPQQLPNAGSFFKNPIVDLAHYQRLLAQHPDLVAYPLGSDRYKLAAAWLLDRAGWKGRRCGALGMHAEQALVLVNHDAANCAQTLDFAQQIQRDIKQRYDVSLEIEPGIF